MIYVDPSGHFFLDFLLGSLVTSGLDALQQGINILHGTQESFDWLRFAGNTLLGGVSNGIAGLNGSSQLACGYSETGPTFGVVWSIGPSYNERSRYGIGGERPKPSYAGLSDTYKNYYNNALDYMINYVSNEGLTYAQWINGSKEFIYAVMGGFSPPLGGKYFITSYYGFQWLSYKDK